MRDELKSLVLGLFKGAACNLAVCGQVLPVCFLVRPKDGQEPDALSPERGGGVPGRGDTASETDSQAMLAPLEIALIPLSWSDDAQKDALVASVRKEARQFGARTVILISEAWERTMGGPDWDGIRPEDDPQRREALHCYIEDADEGVWLAWSQIHRNSNNDPSASAVPEHFEPAQGQSPPWVRIQKMLA